MKNRNKTAILLSIILILAAGAIISCSQDPKTSKVTLVTNGGTIATGKDVTGYLEGKGVSLPLSSDISRDGYTFAGWYDNPDFTGNPVTAIGSDATGDKTFYARWEEILYYYITSDSTTLEKGRRYTISSDVTNTNRLTVDGSATILLPDGFTLTLGKGITVSGSNALVIDTIGDNSTGALTIREVDSHNAGIGGDGTDSACGTITIKGGTIDILGGTDAAAIGGGYRGNGGTITITGGTVNAESRTSAAAIGGGYQGNGANLTISGGTVTTSSLNGKGIGGGNSNNGTLTIGTFTTPTTEGHLRIAEGWSLFYGTLSANTQMKGPNDLSSFDGYCMRYMTVRPTTD